MRDLARVVGYTLGAALILNMYLIVPVLVTLRSQVPPLGWRLLIAVVLLVIVEVPVVGVLIRTSRPIGTAGPASPTPEAPTRLDSSSPHSGVLSHTPRLDD